VTQDELERARNPVVSELRRLLETNSYLLSALISGSQENPEKLKRGTTSLAELQSLTVEDLNAVARKYLAPEAALPVVIVPRHQTRPNTSLQPAESLRLSYFSPQRREDAKVAQSKPFVRRPQADRIPSRALCASAPLRLS